MSHLRVDPRKTHTVEMRDGTKYPVGRNGSVHITDPRHERELAAHGAPDEGESGYVDGMRLGFIASTEKACPCGWYTGWPWTRTCPRCGRAL